MADSKKGLGGAPLQRAKANSTRASSLVSAVRRNDESSVLNLDMADIADNPENPEARVDDVAELVASMREVGQLQPGLVIAAEEYLAQYPAHAEAVGDRSWVLLAGHRRRAAAQQAGLETFQALRRGGTRLDETVLHENLHRKALTPVEEAQAFARVMERRGLGQRTMAEHAGVSQSYVAKRLSLLKLPEQLQQTVSTGVLAPSAALEMVRNESPETLEEVAAQWTHEAAETSDVAGFPSDMVHRARRVTLTRSRVAAAKEKAEAEGAQFLEDPAETLGARRVYDHVLHTPKEIAAARERGDLAYAPTTAWNAEDTAPLAYRLSAPEVKDTAGDSDWQAQRREAEAAKKAATKRRREFLAETVKRKPASPEVMRLLTMTALAGESIMSHVTGLARRLAQGAGVGPTSEANWEWRCALGDTQAAAAREHLAWIITLAIWEDRTKNSVTTHLPVEVIAYMDHLIERGYVPSESEQAHLDESRALTQAKKDTDAAEDPAMEQDTTTDEGEQA